MQEIFRTLKAARKAKSLSQQELGMKTGLPQSHISKIEAGEVDIRFSNILEISRVLDLELMLIPVPMRSLIRNIIAGEPQDSGIPAWRPDEDED